MDDASLIAAEEAHLARRNDSTRREGVEAYRRCGLLSEEDAASLKPIADYFGADFFELMSEVYANAGMFLCALRWHRELIMELERQEPDPTTHPDAESVYASRGYCLYSLGLFEEAIAWSKSCIGPRQLADTVCRAMLNYEAQLQGGCVQGVERAASKARYTVSAFDPTIAKQLTPRLTLAMSTAALFLQNQIDWISSEGPAPEVEADGYPFQAERDNSNLTRHRMNLLCATRGQAVALMRRGHIAEAKGLLLEAAMLEPRADFIQERIKLLP